MTRSKTSSATGTNPGCATQVPSCPSVASRSLSARTCVSASSFATGSVLIGINALIPPIALTPRLWQVFIATLEILTQKRVVLLTPPPSGSKTTSTPPTLHVYEQNHYH